MSIFRLLITTFEKKFDLFKIILTLKTDEVVVVFNSPSSVTRYPSELTPPTQGIGGARASGAGRLIQI